MILRGVAKNIIENEVGGKLLGGKKNPPDLLVPS